MQIGRQSRVCQQEIFTILTVTSAGNQRGSSLIHDDCLKTLKRRHYIYNYCFTIFSTIAFDIGMAVTPCTMMLRHTVHTTIVPNIFPPTRFSFNTILARPPGPNQPRKSLVFIRSPVPAREIKICNMRTIVKLSTE